jgi:hypothetical protein
MHTKAVLHVASTKHPRWFLEWKAKEYNSTSVDGWENWPGRRGRMFMEGNALMYEGWCPSQFEDRLRFFEEIWF